MMQHKADEKGIEMLTDIETGVPQVLVGDSVRLNQVLINLAGNAIKFTEKGSVTLEVKKGSGEQRIRFSIIDTGIGIPPEKLQTVFESFTQAHSSDTRKFGGTGLGLTISRQLVGLMDGESFHLRFSARKVRLKGWRSSNPQKKLTGLSLTGSGY
jgi:signal transduction histidine kinase